MTQDRQKWIVLALAAFTSLLVYAMPLLSLPVLFTEISEDLDLSLAQIGLVWGATSLASVLTSIFYGSIGDRLGARRTLTLACLLVGLLGALRGLSFDFASFILTVGLNALIAPAIPPNIHKIAGNWFADRRGFAAGIVSAGFALGLALGSGLSASVFSPLFGGWQRVMFFYGGLAILFAALWFFLYPESEPEAMRQAPRAGSLTHSLRYLVGTRELWIIGLGTLFFWACYKGFSGYLPLYLKNSGWEPARADQAMASFYIISLLGVLPLSVLSDRLHIKRELMFGAVAVMAVGVLSISFAEGVLVWLALLVAGFFFDAYMAIHQAAVLEIQRIDYAVAGVALGFNATLRELGGFVSPPIGNWLAESDPAAPFVFWAIMGLLGAAILTRLPKRSLAAEFAD
ncbi:MAG: MFS transporter [Anaerolineales bacterium]|nr:MFS transporter [Anaerolineales bacterium]